VLSERKEIEKKNQYIGNEVSHIFKHLVNEGFNYQDDRKKNIFDGWVVLYSLSKYDHPQEVIAAAKNYVLRVSFSANNSDEEYGKFVKLALQQLDNLSQALNAQQPALLQNELYEIKNNQTEIIEALNKQSQKQPFYSLEFREILSKLDTLLINRMQAVLDTSEQPESKVSNKRFSKFF